MVAALRHLRVVSAGRGVAAAPTRPVSAAPMAPMPITTNRASARRLSSKDMREILEHCRGNWLTGERDNGVPALHGESRYPVAWQVSRYPVSQLSSAPVILVGCSERRCTHR